jgi:hypothetical protein
MTLQSLIQSGNYESPQAAYNAITSPTIEVRDDDLYTWAGVALVGGPVAAESLRIALEQNGMGWAVHQLGGSGLQLSNPLVQGALLQLAQAGVPGCAELASTGISFVTPWQQAGIEQPTLEQVTTAWNAWKAETDLANLRESLRIRFDAVLNQVGTGEQPQAVAELRLIANELES